MDQLSFKTSLPSDGSGDRLVDRLLEVGFRIRNGIRLDRDPAHDARFERYAAGDVCYAIDRRAEHILVPALQTLLDEWLPIDLICEGVGDDGRLRIGGGGKPKLTLLVDPIDGTRPLMYDKRAAWFIATAGPGGARTHSAMHTAVLVELPTSKQLFADAYAVGLNGRIEATRQNLLSGETSAAPFRPSSAPSLTHGFGQISDFFPATMLQAAALTQRIVERVLGANEVGRASLFNDQYLSTGGQIVELLSGRDRFCCDLRPVFHQALDREGMVMTERLCCHPYDLGGIAIAQAAGVIVTDAWGKPLDFPLDVTSEVAWCGYANRAIHDAIAPVIAEFLDELL